MNEYFDYQLMFASPERAKQILAKRKRFERQLFDQAKVNAIAWNEDTFKMPNPRVVILGETWKPPFLPIADGEKSGDGELIYLHNTIAAGQWIDVFQGNRRGHAAFTTDVTIPVLGKFKVRHSWEDRIWMSYTPMEVLTCRSGIMRATGTVLLGGLGIGYMLRKVCAKPSVKRVIVVEKSKELLSWFGRRLCSEYPKVSDVICGDALQHLDGRHGSETRYLIDIWSGYGGNGHEREIRDARSKGLKIWCWGST